MSKWFKFGCCLTVLLGTFTVAGSAQGRPPGGRPWEPRPGMPPERQGDRPGPPEWGRPPGGDFRGPTFEMFSDNKVIKGAPYSAIAITETVQTLGDGTRITNKKSDTIYRDNDGRTRREQTIDRVGPFSVGDQPQQVIFINDPVAGQSYILEPHRRIARKLQRLERLAPNFRPPPSEERNTEALGKQLFDGIEAEGTRLTVTIPAGKIGNDRPLEIVSERWESIALQAVVFSKHKDPFAGETTYRLTEIKRNEPARNLFEVPAEYAIEENRPPGPPDQGGRRKPPQ